jgi:adenine C2-methylase RlmN of 23S rRNA A2503 and tRNA A37
MMISFRIKEIGDAAIRAAEVILRACPDAEHVHVHIKLSKDSVDIRCRDSVTRLTGHVNLIRNPASARRKPGRATEERVLQEYELLTRSKQLRSQIIEKIARKVQKGPRHVLRILWKYDMIHEGRNSQ